VTATILHAEPVPIVEWGSGDRTWLEARNFGISASDVAAVLGFSQYSTPWEVWAEKTGIRPRTVDADRESIQLGIALEPWLLVQAKHLLDVPVKRTESRLYAHPDDRWQLASPDGIAIPGDVEPYGIEAKTAGLASGFGIPDGWTDDRVPLGYEFQARWQMRVMGWRKVAIVALVAGLGLRTYEIRRDLRIEMDMVEQVGEWYRRHVLGKTEPPLGSRDNSLMDELYPGPDAGTLQLDNDPDILGLVSAYQSGIAREVAGRAEKETATAAMKRKLGNHCIGTLDGREVITWRTKRGNIRWPDFLNDLYEVGGWDPDDIPSDVEPYRSAPTRSIHVKGVS
jgi:putative phage-type endonuclease